MVQLGGLEPPASGSTDRRSNQLSYSCTDSAMRYGSQSGTNLGASLEFGKPGTLHPLLGSTAAHLRSNAKKPGW